MNHRRKCFWHLQTPSPEESRGTSQLEKNQHEVKLLTHLARIPNQAHSLSGKPHALKNTARSPLELRQCDDTYMPLQLAPGRMGWHTGMIKGVKRSPFPHSIRTQSALHPHSEIGPQAPRRAQFEFKFKASKATSCRRKISISS